LNKSFDKKDPSASQLQEIARITDRFNNFECVQCANAIQEYAIENEISGTRIELQTPRGTRGNDFLVDDSVNLPNEEPISTNGKHLGIGFYNENGEQVVFDNHHRTPVPKKQWLDNFFFPGKIFGQEFDIEETNF
jgi:Papain fold toxin 2